MVVPLCCALVAKDVEAAERVAAMRRLWSAVRSSLAAAKTGASPPQEATLARAGAMYGSLLHAVGGPPLLASLRDAAPPLAAALDQVWPQAPRVPAGNWRSTVLRAGPAAHRFLAASAVALGDISRYRARASADEAGARALTAHAVAWYGLAAVADPMRSTPHNQLAVVAASTRDLPTAVFHYARCLASPAPLDVRGVRAPYQPRLNSTPRPHSHALPPLVPSASWTYLPTHAPSTCKCSARGRGGGRTARPRRA